MPLAFDYMIRCAKPRIYPMVRTREPLDDAKPSIPKKLFMKQYIIALFLLFSVSPALAIETAAKQAIVLDDDTGTVLFEKSADEKMHPSSMSKLMTAYLVFTRL